MSIARPPLPPFDSRQTDWVALGIRRRPWRRLRLALIVGWRAAELDRQLAAGVSPWSSDELAFRARRITRRRSRSGLASGVSRALAAALQGTGFSAAVRPHAGEVLEARTVLSAIAQRLRAPEPVAARGVAMVHVLLTDGNSPLYQPAMPGALSRRLLVAADAMEPTDSDGGVT